MKSMELLADARQVNLVLFSRSLSGDIVRVLVNDGFAPERRETEVRFVSLDMVLFSLSQSA